MRGALLALILAALATGPQQIGTGLGITTTRAGGETVPADPRWDTLLAGWRLEEASAGSSQVDRAEVLGVYTLTDVNTVASATGIIGNAGLFNNAANERLERASSGALSFASDTSVRAGAFWCKPTTHASPQNTIFRVGDVATESGAWRLSVTSADNLQFIWRDSGGQKSVIVNSVVANDSWLFAAWWYNPGDGLVYLQADGGTPVASASTVSFEATAASLLRVGFDFTTSDFNGAIDEPYLFSAGSDAWADDMHNAGSGRAYPN